MADIVDWKTKDYHCKHCGWSGTGQEIEIGEQFRDLCELDCPKCGETIDLLPYPSIEQAKARMDAMDPFEREMFEFLLKHHARFDEEKLKSPDDLHDIDQESFFLHWDFEREGDEYGACDTVIRLDGLEVFREPAMYEGYERFIDVAHILKEKYGTALKDLIPTRASQIYLYGDCLSAPEKVDQARRDIFITSGEA